MSRVIFPRCCPHAGETALVAEIYFIVLANKKMLHNKLAKSPLEVSMSHLCYASLQILAVSTGTTTTTQHLYKATFKQLGFQF